jgi:hypothetical protein
MMLNNPGVLPGSLSESLSEGPSSPQLAYPTTFMWPDKLSILYSV